MKLNWSESADNTMMNTVTFFIAQNDTHSFVYNVEGTIYLDEKKFPDATGTSKNPFFQRSRDEDLRADSKIVTINALRQFQTRTNR